ncbi:MAG: DUF2283 domain-containing protein [Armatimonadetes bacterium]|nr:DUF2283 domain-containing protein [Armatimonadota bacterium]
MKVKYDKQVDILLIELSDKKIDYAEETGSMIIHFTKEGEPVLVEILEASEFLAEVIKASLKGSMEVAI